MRKLPTILPQSLKKYFWDVDTTKLNPAKSPQYTINRLLDKGDFAAARFVLQHFPKSLIIDTLKTMRDFSPWNGVFWALYLGIPKEEVKCLQTSYLKQRKILWPY